MQKIFKLIEQEGIILRYADLLIHTDNKLYGMMIFGPTFGSLMVLDSTLEKPENRRLFRCVSAHELGHFYTSPRSNVLEMYGACSLGIKYKLPESLMLEITMVQDEYKATEWAGNLLIPDDEFSHAIAGGCQSVYDLAEWFDVTEWFVYRKLGVMKRKYREVGIKLKSRDYFNAKLF